MAAFLVTSKQNMLIVHPDLLLSGTRVGDSVSCIRRAVLSERVQVEFWPPPLLFPDLFCSGTLFKPVCDSWYDSPRIVPAMLGNEAFLTESHPGPCSRYREVSLSRLVRPLSCHPRSSHSPPEQCYLKAKILISIISTLWHPAYLPGCRDSFFGRIRKM
jgi:hypothetical protein